MINPEASLAPDKPKAAPAAGTSSIKATNSANTTIIIGGRVDG